MNDHEDNHSLSSLLTKINGQIVAGVVKHILEPQCQEFLFFKFEVFFYKLLLQEAEEFLSNLVIKKTIYAKVDRLAGIVNFAPAKDPNEILNNWSSSLNELMQLVNKTTHLINKEEMLHEFTH